MSQLFQEQQHNKPADFAAREQALNPNASFIVTAPAGSGKTGLLTQRILTLLALCENPEEVLAITFTRKAAQEMRSRIITALRTAEGNLNSDNPHERKTALLAQQVIQKDQEKNWRLLLTPSRLRIQTIDSFCQYLAKQLPFDSGLSGFLDPTENAQMLYQKAVQAFFTHFKSESPFQQDLLTVFEYLDCDLGKLEKLLVALLSSRSQWLSLLYSLPGEQHNSAIQDSLDSIAADTLIHCRNLLVSHLPELAPLVSHAANHLNNEALANLVDSEFDADVNQLDAWQSFAELLTKDKGEKADWRKTVTKSQGFPPANKQHPEWKETKDRFLSLLEDFATNTELLDAIRDLRCLPQIAMSDNQWQLLDSLTRLLPILVAEFKITCFKDGECDFEEHTLTALDALGTTDAPTDLALKLDYQIRHILVDEFQDTSLPQLQLLEKLTATWLPDDGRTVFLVGDAMQSCYAFRNANVSLFLQVRDHGIADFPLTPLSLTVNFRSSAPLIDWYNATFQSVFPTADNRNRGAVKYQLADKPADSSELNNARKLENLSSVHCHGFVRTADDTKNSFEQAKTIVSTVNQQLAESSDTSIAILVRAKTHLSEILDALREAGLKWQAQDIDLLRQRMIVIDLLSLTRALLDFSDRVAWLSILRAPWCGLDNTDLHAIANIPAKGEQNKEPNKNNHKNLPSVWQQMQRSDEVVLSDHGKTAINKLTTILTTAISTKGRKTLRNWIESVWLALGGPATIANPAEQHSTDTFFSLLDNHCVGGHIENWRLFDDALSKLYDKSEEQSRLQIMTMHKSKGLEFDTVILPALEKRPKQDDKQLLRWLTPIDSNGQSHLLLSPLNETSTSNSLYDYLTREQKLRNYFESARLLYIACTRAIDSLYLFANFTEDENGTLKDPDSSSLLNHLWPALRSEFTLDRQSSDEEISTKKRTADGILRLPIDWKSASIPNVNILPENEATKINNAFTVSEQERLLLERNIPPNDALVNRVSRWTGSLFHAAIEQIIAQGLHGWSGDRTNKQIPFWEIQLRQFGCNPQEAKLGAKTIAQAVNNTLTDDRGRWLLAAYPDSGSEMSLLTGDGGFRESIIDRWFIDGDTCWVIDFKTSEAAKDQPPSDFFQEEKTRYQHQLDRYRQLMIRLFDQQKRHITVKTALYFPLIPHFEIC